MANPKGAGRKLRLTPKLIDEICAQVARGVTFKDAAAICDIGQTTFYRWRKQAKRARTGIYAEFEARLRKAQAEATGVLIDTAREAAQNKREVVTVEEHVDADGVIVKRVVRTQTLPPDGALALKILERRHPNRYGVHRIEHSGKIKGGGNVPVQLIFDDGAGSENPPTPPTDRIDRSDITDTAD